MSNSTIQQFNDSTTDDWMRQRSIAVDDVKRTLLTGKIVERYERDWPLPSCLILGYTEDDRPIHLVVAIDDAQEILWVITIYEPNRENWEKGFTARSKQ